jgi:probable HAF family extracellular repeat protein
MQDLDTLGGNNSWGRDINNSHRVVGESDTDPATTGGSSLTRAFLWQNGTMTDLGALASNAFSAASAINNSGVIVGWAGNEDGQRRAFIYENGSMRNLNDLICTQTEEGVTFVPGIMLTEARDINGDGWIVGWGDVRASSSGGTRGFLLIPIDSSECEVEEEEEADDASTGSAGNGASGAGSSVAGNAILGTPANLGDATVGDTTTSDSDNSPTPTSGLCGLGAAGLMPLTLAGLWLMKLRATRLRRTPG